MCVCASVPSPLPTGLRRAKNFDTSIPLPNFWLLKRLLFWKTEQSWKSQIPQILDCLKILIFHWGARLSTFSWMDTVLGYILKKLNLYSLKNLATINFSARTVCLYNGIDFLWINGYIWKKPNLGGWISPNLFKFSHLFRVLFLRFVSIAKFTERHFLKAQTSTLEFSEYLKLN